MSDFHNLVTDLGEYPVGGLEPDEFLRQLRKYGFMLLPYSPNDADLAVMVRQFPIAGGRIDHVRLAYAALVARRKDMPPDPPPVKAPRVRQDERDD
jgi:hypothetical protein